MVDISQLRAYYKNEDVLISNHAAMRFRQRGIKLKDIRCAVNNGKIIEQYPEDFPFPSCLILGRDMRHNVIHVVMSDEGTMGRIITAYYPDPDRWDSKYEARKE